MEKMKMRTELTREVIVRIKTVLRGLYGAMVGGDEVDASLLLSNKYPFLHESHLSEAILHEHTMAAMGTRRAKMSILLYVRTTDLSIGSL